MSTNDLPEAPASITLSVTTTKGYPALLTLRETTGTVLLEKVTLLEAKLEALGYKPQERGFKGGGMGIPKTYVEGVICPKDGARLVEKTKKDGQKFHQCENRKWNPLTNTNSGCDYVDWDAGKPKEPVLDEPPMPVDKF